MWSYPSARSARRLCSIAGLAAALVVGAQPAHADSGGRQITLADAVRLALAHNPDSRSADADITSAEGAVTQAKVLPNPDIFLYTIGRGLNPFDAPVPNQYGFTWTIPVSGKRGAGIRVAKAGVEAAHSTRQVARRQLALQVETAFIGVLLDQSILEFAEQDQQAFQQSVAINEIRYKDGKIAFGDVLKLRIQARQVNDTVRQARQSEVNDRAELGRLLGASVVSSDLRLAGALEPVNEPVQVSAQSVVDEALKQRPDYQALFSQLEGARASVSLARRQAIPDIGLLADYDYIPRTAGNYDLELTATVPLFDWNQGNVKSARAQLVKAQLAVEHLREQIAADAKRAVEEWRVSQERLSAYGKEFVSMAQQSLDISRHSYEEGRGSLLDFLDAESSYRDVQRAYRSAQAEAMLAAANLKYVSGEELP